ncbi:ABC transporter ATP-binding protein [Actinoallomurus sp. CA-150999]|uniref:ABC transporter ATP-binding protein n=1 Tax=Actinoallomurus sp. CA-150999 TaxID=3239887 RepID=UPI003D911494
MLTLRDVESGYGSTTVLHGISREVAAGEVTVLLGRNGVGKTTLLRTVIGQLSLRRGSITLADHDIGGLRAYRRARLGLAYVPQGRDIFPGLSVRENLRVAVLGVRRRDWNERLEQVLEEFPQLKDKLRAPGRSLSGGQQQVLAIARALITDPRALLLDEPSEGIQPSVVTEIAEMLVGVARERDIAVLVAEQNLDFVQRVCTHVDVIDKGRLVAKVSVDELMTTADLQHKYLGV